MKMRERVMEALTWGDPDYVPWIPKRNHTPRDSKSIDRLLEIGMGRSYPVSVTKVSRPNVETETKINGDYKKTIYRTPVGEIFEKRRINLPTDEGERGDSWIVDPVIKGPDDYKVLEFMTEDEVVEPSYEGLEEKKEEVSDHGVLQTGTGYTPFMQLVVRYMGFKRVVIELRRRREMVEGLMELMGEVMRKRVEVVADSPVRIVKIGDNIDGLMINPRLYESYCIPYHQEFSDMLHGGGKIAMSHMDGRLKIIKDLIPETGLDVVQAFTPPPMGDLSIAEARQSWGQDLAIWANIPEVIFYKKDPDIEEYIHGLLKEAAPGRGLVFGITETVPPKERDRGLEAITRAVMKYGKLPVQGG